MGDLAIAYVGGTPPRSCSSRDHIGTTAIHLCTGSGTPVQILKTLQNENFVLSLGTALVYTVTLIVNFRSAVTE